VPAFIKSRCQLAIRMPTLVAVTGPHSMTYAETKRSCCAALPIAAASGCSSMPMSLRS
jgi:hypothetical protein